MSTSSLVGNPAAAQAVATRVRWKIFFLMLMLTSINYIDRASLSVAMPLIGKEFASSLDLLRASPPMLMPSSALPDSSA
jgi:hypothetical protein